MPTHRLSAGSDVVYFGMIPVSIDTPPGTFSCQSAAIIDNDNSFAFKNIGNRIELQLNPEMANSFLGFNKGPANIMISRQTDFKRKPHPYGIAKSRRDS